MNPLLIDGDTLTIDNVNNVAMERRRVALHPGTQETQKAQEE
jgi:hypothetical protein